MSNNFCPIGEVMTCEMDWLRNVSSIGWIDLSSGSLLKSPCRAFKNELSKNNIETIEKSIITTCNYHKLEELCSVSLTAANFSRYILGNLMLQMSNRITYLQHMSAKEKYQHLLEENPNIILRVPLGMIASYLGISQETLSRIRSEI